MLYMYPLFRLARVIKVCMSRLVIGRVFICVVLIGKLVGYVWVWVWVCNRYVLSLAEVGMVIIRAWWQLCNWYS